MTSSLPFGLLSVRILANQHFRLPSGLGVHPEKHSQGPSLSLAPTELTPSLDSLQTRSGHNLPRLLCPHVPSDHTRGILSSFSPHLSVLTTLPAVFTSGAPGTLSSVLFTASSPYLLPDLPINYSCSGSVPGPSWVGKVRGKVAKGHRGKHKKEHVKYLSCEGFVTECVWQNSNRTFKTCAAYHVLIMSQ